MSEVFVEEVEAENEIGEMGSEEESEDFETLKEHATERFQLLGIHLTKMSNENCGNLIVHNLKI